jgi:hypothetical protein
VAIPFLSDTGLDRAVKRDVYQDQRRDFEMKKAQLIKHIIASLG